MIFFCEQCGRRTRPEECPHVPGNEEEDDIEVDDEDFDELDDIT